MQMADDSLLLIKLLWGRNRETAREGGSVKSPLSPSHAVTQSFGAFVAGSPIIDREIDLVFTSLAEWRGRDAAAAGRH